MVFGKGISKSPVNRRSKSVSGDFLLIAPTVLESEAKPVIGANHVVNLDAYPIRIIGQRFRYAYVIETRPRTVGKVHLALEGLRNGAEHCRGNDVQLPIVVERVANEA